ncbi:MAG: adenosine deaminase [Planctomycetes bacterium]|nr:adenosine deaminase [Planctomycetota bacterium]
MAADSHVERVDDEPRNVLLCTLGMSWPVIPEVYAFLAPDSLPLYQNHPEFEKIDAARRDRGLEAPHEVWLVTTRGDKAVASIDLVRDWRGKLANGPVLRVWSDAVIEDLTTQEQCARFQELVLRVGLKAHEHVNRGQLVLSLAGGRKTMSADLQWAGHLFGCRALVHVLMQGNARGPADEDVDRWLAPLPRDDAARFMPVVAEACRRNELLDIELDNDGRVTSRRFPVPFPEDGKVEEWSAPDACRLRDEVRRREREGSGLLGNYLAELARVEHHENWRSVYRLPPSGIERLRSERIEPRHRDWLASLPKADLHRHIGGCLSVQQQQVVAHAIWDVLNASERGKALRSVRHLVDLDGPDWPWDWPDALGDKNSLERSHRGAALLIHADRSKLEHALYESTSPRVALTTRHDGKFKAYERPGALSGSVLLRHPAAWRPYAETLVKQARAEGLAYVELRGSPTKYGNALAFLEAFEKELRRAVHARPAADRPVFRFIIIGDRRIPESVSDAVDFAVRAKKDMPDFIAGLDIAGDERATPPRDLEDAFEKAFEVCLPITIHAGEGESAHSIWEAAYRLHADRIGHGLTIGEHAHLAQRFRDRGICIELCPTSNREVVGFRDPDVPSSESCAEYPLMTLWEQGLPLAICTDNPGIGRTTLADEFLAAARMSPRGITLWDALAMIKQSFVHAFLPSERRETLLKQVDADVFRRLAADDR